MTNVAAAKFLNYDTQISATCTQTGQVIQIFQNKNLFKKKNSIKK